jgi:hypothetical protein
MESLLEMCRSLNTKYESRGSPDSAVCTVLTSPEARSVDWFPGITAAAAALSFSTKTFLESHLAKPALSPIKEAAATSSHLRNERLDISPPRHQVTYLISHYSIKKPLGHGV